MAYELHIERPPESPDDGPVPIRIDEWKAAVQLIPSLRLFPDTHHSITNPVTGEAIRIKATEGDVEIYIKPEGTWQHLFRWRSAYGSASFNARVCEPENPTDPIWAAASALAKQLGAVIRGDDLETYDLDKGHADECCSEIHTSSHRLNAYSPRYR